MSTVANKTGPWAKYASTIGIAAIFTGGVVLLLLWLAGKFAPKVPSSVGHALDGRASALEYFVAARILQLPREESAVGSIRAVHETTVGSKLLARVVEIDLKAGQVVRKNDVLVRLDDTDLKARQQQAEAAVMSAEATLSQAERDDQRSAQLLETKTITRQEREKAATALKSAQAELRRAREAVNEVTVTLDWATVRAPMDGKIVDKKVNAGDLVTPGQPLATLFDPRRMQLVASVRESLTRHLEVGQTVNVRVQDSNTVCQGTVSEIVPETRSASRSFEIKVTGPCPTGVYSGMFGRVYIPLEDEKILVIPRSAVKSVGQVELVDVADEQRITRRAIRTGRILDDEVEVLSGLKSGERVVTPEKSDDARRAAETGHD